LKLHCGSDEEESNVAASIGGLLLSSKH